MKKYVLLFQLTLMSVGFAFGQTILYNDVYYKPASLIGTAVVTAPPSFAYAGDLTIVPSFSYAGKIYTVTGIEDKAFQRADNVTSVEIPEGLTFIGKQAFIDCTGLTSIVLPSTIETIGEKAFYCCQNLKSITIPVKEIGKSAFGECSSLETVNIPNTVTIIGIEAFNFCKNLKTVIIGKGVKEIKAQAFANNHELRTVYCYAEAVPKTETSAFYEMWEEKTTLYVPENLIGQYRSQLPWSKFNFIYSLDGESPSAPNGTCATPIITIIGKKIVLSCETPGATFSSTLTTQEQLTGDELTMESRDVTYTLTVVASAEGYDDSAPATVNFTIPRGDINGDGEVNSADIQKIYSIMAEQ